MEIVSDMREFIQNSQIPEFEKKIFETIENERQDLYAKVSKNNL